MEQRVTLITLAVTDLDRARRFYVEGLGWAPVLDLPEVCFVPVGHGLTLSLWPRPDFEADIGDGATTGEAATAPFTLAHNVESAEAVDEFVAAFVAAGGRVLKAAQRADWGGYHGVVADPDGFRWEVAHNPGLSTGPDGTPVFGG